MEFAPIAAAAAVLFNVWHPGRCLKEGELVGETGSETSATNSAVRAALATRPPNRNLGSSEECQVTTLK